VQTRHAHCGFLEKNIPQPFIFSLVFVGFINWVFKWVIPKKPAGFSGKNWAVRTLQPSHYVVAANNPKHFSHGTGG
jgi:hypothetical protein